MPIIVLAGEEEFRISRRAKALREKLVDKAWETFNFQRIDNPDIKDVLDAAGTVAFGPGNKMVMFADCALFTKKRAAKDDDSSSSSSKSSKLIDDLDASLKTVAPNTYLVFSCVANFDSTLKVSKVFAKYADIEKFEKVKYYAGAENSQLIDFCNKEAHKVGACIDDDAAFYLAESSEVDLRTISSEIAKAATYILPEKTIKLQHVAMLSPHYSHVFELMEQWALGKRTEVLQSIKEIQAKQVSPHMVIAAMQTVLTKWIGYKIEVEKACAVPSGSRDVKRRDVPLNELARKIAFDQRTAFLVEKDLRRIKALSLQALVDRKQLLTEVEAKIKSGQMPESHALEYFFTCPQRQRA